MNVSELVEFVDRTEHLGNIESSVLLFEDARVVEECPEIATRDVFLQPNEGLVIWGVTMGGRAARNHSEVDMCRVLKGV
jgi:hypothetical protein